MEEAERGTVGRRQVLYIAVSVGRYCIDRKDTIFYPKQSRGRERDNEPERERWEKKEMLVHVCETGRTGNISSVTQVSSSKYSTLLKLNLNSKSPL